MRRRKTRRLWGIGAGGLVSVLAGVLVAVTLAGSERTDAPESHGAVIGALRTLAVATEDTGRISEPGSATLHAVLTAGSVPATPVKGTVLSDENCAPDAMGVSHCTNRVKLDGGGEMTVMHPHRMSDVPCLAPDERIIVRAA